MWPGDEPPRWPFAIEVESSPSAFEGLSRVEVVVVLDDPEVDSEPIELARLVTLVDEREPEDLGSELP